MPRSATDATRFTSTTPHASAILSKKPPPLRASGPPGETPQEKVKRLRAAADRARDAQISSFDRVVIRGRKWADTAHKITTLTLIGATVIAAGVTVYALGDMMIYNRRKRAQFFEEQKARLQSAIYTARTAIEAGTATPEQIRFIELEDAHQAQLAEKKNKKGVFARGKEWMFSGLKKEDETSGSRAGGGSRPGYDVLDEVEESIKQKERDVLGAVEHSEASIAARGKQAFADEKERQRTGGPLDRLGTSTADDSSVDERPKSRGWTSWMNTRS